MGEGGRREEAVAEELTYQSQIYEDTDSYIWSDQGF